MKRKASFWKEHMEYLERKAYAKINLNLNVLGKRPDGFHELETLMQAVDLSDRVRTGWEPCPTGLPSYAAPCADFPGELAVDVRTSTPALPGGPENLAYRAAVSMHAHYRAGICERITVDIEKNIPIAAGLAGGSADAAAVLLSLADLWELSDEQRIDLVPLAAALGSDVPFCMAAQSGLPACIATGRGEMLQPVMPLSCKVLLSTPDFAVSTAEVYAELQESDYRARFDTGSLVDALPMGAEAAAPRMGNHLQAPALRLYPDIQETIDWVSAQNDQVAVLVAGSGPTVFGLYPHGSEMERTCSCHGPNPYTHFVSTLA